MKLVKHPSAVAFLERARAYLLADEVSSALVLGIAGELERHLGADEPPLLATLEDEGDGAGDGDDVVAVTMRTPPFPLIVHGDPAAIRALAAELALSDPALPGVTGHLEAAEAFAAAWPQPHADRRLTMQLYALRAVVPPARPAPGALRCAEPDDLEWLCAWVARFTEDTGMSMEDETIERRRRRVSARLADGSIFVWQHARAVAIASVAGKTPSGVRVNMVYTPPEQRGQGYASACVAALAQRMLDEGNEFVCLYADRDEPGVNRIYQRVGFQPVCQSAQIRFFDARVAEL